MSIGILQPSDYELPPPDEGHRHHGERGPDGTHTTVEYQRRPQGVSVLGHTEVCI